MNARAQSEARRRDQLLEAAARLVVHRGPAGTNVAEIAKAAGVAVGSVYLEFAGKSEILGALSDDRLQQVLAAMRAAAAPRPDQPPGFAVAERLCDALETRTRALGAHLADGQHTQSLLHCACEGVEAAWRRFEAATQALLEATLAESEPGGSAPGGSAPGGSAPGGSAGAPAGAPAAVPVAATARALLRAYADFVPPRLCAHDPAHLETELRALRRLVQDGLRPRP